jgi:nucleoside-diphosphate-sugar epimerase
VSDGPGLVLVTGAAGFLGAACCEYLADAGYRVRALVRDPGQTTSIEAVATDGVFQGDLPDRIDTVAFAGGVRAIVHCAFTTRGTNRTQVAAANLTGSRRLLELARGHDIDHFVFISSLAATPAAESFYGRSKRQVEQMLDPNRDLVLRPGLIMGRGGLFERMCRSLQTVPLVPQFYGGRQEMQTVWVDDVCAAIETGIRRRLRGAFGIAAPEGISIRRFYRGIAALTGTRCRFVRLPGPPLVAALRVVERLGVSLPISSDNLLGLKHMRLWPLADDLRVLDMTPLTFEESLERLRRTQQMPPSLSPFR